MERERNQPMHGICFGACGAFPNERDGRLFVTKLDGLLRDDVAGLHPPTRRADVPESPKR